MKTVRQYLVVALTSVMVLIVKDVSAIKSTTNESPSDCGTRSYTIGGWSADPKGNNPGIYLDANFSSAFPYGFSIGCSSFSLAFSSPEEVRSYLKQGGGTPALLSEEPNNNTLAQQLVGVTLNSQFFGLGSEYITSGPYEGMTVNDFLRLANESIGGCVSGYNLAELNIVASAINENYDNGIVNNGFLSCEPPCHMTASASAGSIACNGGTTEISVTADGGTEPYTGTGTFTVSAGSYSFEVRDARGCTFTTSEIVVTEPSALEASITATAILCNGGSSTVTVSAAGGTAPYSGTGEFVVQAGAYSYTVTDANGCTADVSIEISEPSLLTVSASASEILCNGGSAVVTVSASGGTEPYSGIGEFNVSAGSYVYTVTDGNGCTAETSIIVSEPPLLTASSSSTPILCFGGSSTVSITADGGTAPYSGTGDFTVVAGSYVFTVIDSKGCSTEVVVFVTEPPLLLSSIEATPILCYGGTSTVTVSATGGTGDYTGTGSFEVTAGTYTFTVTDSNGCSSAQSISITEPSQLGSATAYTQVTGFQCNDGTITVGAWGGTEPYLYSIDNGTSYQESGTFSGLAAGSYSVIVMDNNGCMTSAQVIVVDTRVCVSTTITMGGWGAACSGGNWGCYLINNWSRVGTIVVGSGSRTLTLTSANAVINYLPSSGSPAPLDKSYTNPTEKSYKNTLAGQAVAATINLRMFGIGDLVVTSGPFTGISVQQLLTLANIALGGGGGSAADITNALDQVNRNFDNGTTNKGFLGCPCLGTGSGRERTIASAEYHSNPDAFTVGSVESYPNPFSDRTRIEFSVTETGNVSLHVYGVNGNKIETLFNGVVLKDQRQSAEFVAPAPGLYIYKLVTGKGFVVGKLIRQK